MTGTCWNAKVADELASYGFTPEEIQFWMNPRRAKKTIRHGESAARAIADVRERHGLSWRDAAGAMFPDLG